MLIRNQFQQPFAVSPSIEMTGWTRIWPPFHIFTARWLAAMALNILAISSLPTCFPSIPSNVDEPQKSAEQWLQERTAALTVQKTDAESEYQKIADSDTSLGDLEKSIESDVIAVER